MIVNYKDKEITLDYKFNSFKYMEDLELNKLTNLENKPFVLFSVAEILVYGALNHDFGVVYPRKFAVQLLEEVTLGGGLMELVESLIKMLEDNDFFKALQENQETV